MSRTTIHHWQAHLLTDCNRQECTPLGVPPLPAQSTENTFCVIGSMLGRLGSTASLQGKQSHDHKRGAEGAHRLRASPGRKAPWQPPKHARADCHNFVFCGTGVVTSSIMTKVLDRGTRCLKTARALAADCNGNALRELRPVGSGSFSTRGNDVESEPIDHTPGARADGAAMGFQEHRCEPEDLGGACPGCALEQSRVVFISADGPAGSSMARVQAKSRASPRSTWRYGNHPSAGPRPRGVPVWSLRRPGDAAAVLLSSASARSLCCCRR